jgi:ankyrin repeat protein
MAIVCSGAQTSGGQAVTGQKPTELLTEQQLDFLDTEMALRENWFEVEKLHRAACEGNLTEISHLVAEGFDINAFDDLSRTPLHYAVEESQFDAARLLISLGSDVNRHDEDMIGETPLSLAAQGSSRPIAVDRFSAQNPPFAVRRS